ncbi:uncharacterized protein LOC120846597 [Ixodes scapularis]|uniref:uncharacterized protein LOC120846597 n=1 Tax=Ixodes scapularis TaxID=6945 RepID=UPI001C391C3D|nr:uncharacterized protein LOC120846597 [Ixodes scapularis]
MRSNILLCVIFIYQLTGLCSLQKLSFEDFIDEVLFRTQRNLYRHLGEGWNISLGTSLQDENGTFIPLGSDNFAKGIGLHYKLKGNGECDTRWSQRVYALRCPVKFDNFKVTLPRLDDEKQYIVRVETRGIVMFYEDGRSMNYIRYIMHWGAYTMTDMDNVIVTKPPARYDLSNKWDGNLRNVLRKKLQAFLTGGEFSRYITEGLEEIRIPPELEE